jgi:RNA polymerase sigma factor (sigma-70 family)
MAFGSPSVQNAAPSAPFCPQSAEACIDAILLDRFVRLRDETAFAALVKTHGPMVLGVCRRVLRHAQDAEDAFQATFLVLARKAGSLEKPELLANWLFGVAFRTAEHARGKAARRNLHEKEVATMFAAIPQASDLDREVREVLDEELFRMPEKYRAPLVLCYLKGMTNEQAAEHLGCPTGSMSARLARAREILRTRLSSRLGVVPGMLMPLALPEISSATAIVPDGLANATIQAAAGLIGAKTVTEVAVSPAVADLLAAMLHRQAKQPSRLLVAMLVAIIVAVGGGTVAYAAGGSSFFRSVSNAVWRPISTGTENGAGTGTGCPGQSRLID